MIEEMLKSYNDYKAEINTKRYKIKLLENETLDGATCNYNPMPSKTGYKDCSTETFALTKIDSISKLHKEIEETEARLNMLDGYINTLNKYNKEIIELYYIKKLRLEEIAVMKDRTINCIAKAKQKSIENMQRKYTNANK